MSVIIVNKVKQNKNTQKIKSIFSLIEKKIIDFLNIKDNIEINVLIVNDEEMQVINMETRGKNCTTDVLSLPLEVEYENKKLLGDIIISMDKAIKQSEEMNNSLEEEISFLFCHGMLHLLGYNHNNKKEEKKMIKLQDQVLKGVVK